MVSQFGTGVAAKPYLLFPQIVPRYVRLVGKRMRFRHRHQHFLGPQRNDVMDPRAKLTRDNGNINCTRVESLHQMTPFSVSILDVHVRKALLVLAYCRPQVTCRRRNVGADFEPAGPSSPDRVSVDQADTQIIQIAPDLFENCVSSRSQPDSMPVAVGQFHTEKRFQTPDAPADGRGGGTEEVAALLETYPPHPHPGPFQRNKPQLPDHGPTLSP